MSDPVRFLDRPEALADLAAELRGESILAIDSEFIREKTYVPRLEIVQIATRGGETVIVDYGTIAARDRLDPDPLAEILASPSILKVFHAAEQDLEMLHLATGVIADPIWDTQLVAGLCGYSGRSGYTSIVEAFLGERPASGEALTDWSRRPLRAEQLRYAAEDVRHLIALHDAERAKLESLGRLSWAEEECRGYRARVASLVTRRNDPAQAYQRVRGFGRLDRKGLAILREVAIWRETEAARRNRPPGTVLRDDLLLEVARRKPTAVADLATLRGFQPRELERFGETIVRAVEAGKRVAPEDRPSPPPPSTDLDEAEQSLATLLLAALQSLAHEHEVSPSLLSTSSDVQRAVEALAGRRPREEVRLLSGWRGTIVGDKIAALADGRLGLRWDADRRRLTIA
jgi:ribonuclease D